MTGERLVKLTVSLKRDQQILVIRIAIEEAQKLLWPS
jgi:hypothetical protein